MNRFLVACLLASGGALLLSVPSSAHGGTYIGPGDTVPPGGGGGGGAPGAPSAGGPATSGPKGPNTPGSATPGVPIGSRPNAPLTPGDSGLGADLTAWQFWWGFNREPYLDLRRHLYASSAATGSPEFFLGHGEAQQFRDTYRPSESQIRDQIVPALLAALDGSTSNDIVTGCLIALAKIGDARDESGRPRSQMAKVIRKHLVSGNQEIQETAAVALGILASEDEIPLLQALLFDDAAQLRRLGVVYNGSVPERTRAFAAYGLGLIGAGASDAGRRTIVAGLIRMLEGPARATAQRDIPVACLTSLGLTPLPVDAAAPLPELVGTTKRPDTVTNRTDQVLWLLSYFEDGQEAFLSRAHAPTAIARLLAPVPDGDPLRREVGLRFAAAIGPHAAGQNEVLQSLILALGQLGDCDSDPGDEAIRKALMAVPETIADVQCRNFALIALGQVGGRPGHVEGEPFAALHERKGSPRTYLIDKLAKGRSSTRCWAALALAVLEHELRAGREEPSQDVRVALRGALEEAGSPDEIGSLALAVGLVGDPEARDLLRERFDSTSEPLARGHVAVALGLMEDRGSIKKITAVLERSRYQADLLKSAAIGLGLMGSKTTVTRLIDMLAAAQSLSSQAAIASALGSIGDSRSVEPLIAMLKDQGKTERARGFAAAALGIVADKEEHRWNSRISVGINYRANTTTLTSPDAGTGILDIL